MSSIRNGTRVQLCPKRIGYVRRSFIKRIHLYSIGSAKWLEHFSLANWAIRKSVIFFFLQLGFLLSLFFPSHLPTQTVMEMCVFLCAMCVCLFNGRRSASSNYRCKIRSKANEWKVYATHLLKFDGSQSSRTTSRSTTHKLSPTGRHNQINKNAWIKFIDWLPKNRNNSLK